MLYLYITQLRDTEIYNSKLYYKI